MGTFPSVALSDTYTTNQPNPTMPTINTIITRDDVRSQRDEVFAVIRDAVVGPFLDAAPSGVTAEVVEFSTDFVVGWKVVVNLDKATADLVARHEVLNAAGAGVHQNVGYGVKRSIVRGYGDDPTLAIVRLVPRRDDSYDLTVTVNALGIGTDDRNNTVASTEDKNWEARTIRVATIKAAAKKQGTAVYDALLNAESNVAHLEANAGNTLALRKSVDEVKAAVTETKAVLSVEWSHRRDNSVGSLTFPYLTPEDALRILKAVNSLPNPASAL